MIGESLLARYQASGKAPRVILLVLLLAGAGYGLYVQTHLQQIHEFNNRELGHAAKVVEEAVAGIMSTGLKWKDSDGLCRFASDQPYLKKTACKESRNVVFQSVALEPENRKLCIKFRLKNPSPAGKAREGATSEAPSFEVDFEAILRELDLPESFELYFIADSKGSIVHAGSSDHARPLRSGGWLNELIAGENAEPGPARRIGDLANLTEIASGKNPFDQFKGGTTRLRIDLSGMSHYVYVQPLNLPLTGNGKEIPGEWFLGGAVSYDDVLRRSFAVDSYLLFGLILIVALGFLGWPFLKIWLIDARERFRSVDVYELLFSAVALASLLVVLGLSWDAYSRLKSEADAKMKRIADDITDKFVKEVGTARDQLEEYDQLAKDLAAKDKIDITTYTPIDSIGQGRGLMPKPPTYWPVRMTWVWPDGEQFLKAEPQRTTTPPANLSQRPYFQGIVNGERWTLDRKHGFVLQPGRSIIDGRFYSYLAIPSSIPATPKQTHSPGAPAVVVMNLKLRSVAPQPLPIGYGFAVVNREGHTLYHNDPRRALREDFVEEVEQHYQLNSTLQGDIDQFLSLTYQTRPHRFYVRPISELRRLPSDLASPPDAIGEQGPGWFILVYRDMTGAHAIATRAIVLSLIFAVLGTLALGMLALLIMRYVSGKLYDGRTAAWMWPSQRGEETYRQIVVGSMILLAGGAAAMAIADGPALVALAVCLPPAVGALWIVLQIRNRRDGRMPTPSRAPLQWAAGALFVLCFAVPLASGFFKFFWNDEMGRYKYAQDFDAFETRKELEAAARRAVRCQPQSPCPEVASVEAYVLDARKATADVRGDGRLASLLSGWMPVQDPVVARIRDSATSTLPRGAPGGGSLSLYSLLVLPAVILAWCWVKVQSSWILLDDLVQPALVPQVARLAVVAAGGSTLSLTTEPPVPDFDSWWARTSDDVKRVMLQVTAERIANPRARETVKELLAAGALVFEPDLGPRPEWREALQKRLILDAAKLREWEKPENADGWKSARWSLVFVMFAISLFLVATQPNLPAQLGALVSTTTVGVSTIRRGLDALGGGAKAAE